MSLIDGLFDNGAMPTLGRTLQFTGARHELIADAIANASTPHYKPRDLDVGSFQKTLREAHETRRRRVNPIAGELKPRNTRELKFERDSLTARPSFANEGVMFHDQNNRDLERMMQHLAENTLAHGAAIELMRNQIALLRTAIRERIA